MIVHHITTHLLSIERADWPKLHDMFKARDAKAWQREFPVGNPVRVCASNLLLINIFWILLLEKKADAWLKQNVSCWSVNSFDFSLEKSREKSNELTDQQDTFYYKTLSEGRDRSFIYCQRVFIF